ncbi:Hypothetical predicted protein [Mytilus galloprovincialis]|uniref:CCHC-type domain-containing protein n=1 Tax=Mytilus galloprovincialis TaxID=29158 RepID=A0A8B6DZX0_MYTGA|nr:Hypothetical predicted protein [Mytilus galloprovincialis]
MDTDLDDSIKAVILREVKNAVSSSQQDLLNSITTVMDSRLSSSQSNLQQSQQEISQTQIAKLEETMTDNYSFQRKGNENQIRQKVKVLTKLKEAKADLEAPELGIGLGWKVVSEYVANPIADDSEDEKKMMRAQSRAERKSKAEKFKKGKPRPTPYSRNPEKETKSVKPGRCFKCGNKGHWVDECPDMKNKISLKLRQNVENVVGSSGVGENNVLRSLAGRMALYIVNSNTSMKYFAGFNRWKLFINEHGFSDLPAEPVHVALYLTFLIDKHSSPSVLQSAIYSIKWAHELNGYIDPTSNSFITFLLESCKRRNGKPVGKKKEDQLIT